VAGLDRRIAPTTISPVQETKIRLCVQELHLVVRMKGHDLGSRS
jgi:hypothetical protein